MNKQAQATVKISVPTMTPLKSNLLQRTCACGESAGIDDLCSECRDKRLTSPYGSQRSSGFAIAPPLVQNNPRSPAEAPTLGANHPINPNRGYNFNQVRIHASAPKGLQTKLTVNQPGDVYEQEADQVAEQAMRMIVPSPSMVPVMPADDESKDESLLRKETGNTSVQGTTGAPPIVNEVLNSGTGQALDGATRSIMEPRFGHDFSKVRVHTDDRAAESTQAVNALAYTVGRDVVFGTGQYIPETHEGKWLLAHELTHVVQQRQVRGLQGILQRKANPEHSTATPSKGTFPLELYVDGYEHANYQIDHRSVKHNLSKWIILTYFDGTVIDVNIDDIGNEILSPEELIKQYEGHRGAGGRFFPERMNRSTTPRLWAAKQEVLKIMDDYNLKLELIIFPALWLILTSAVPAGAGTPPKATRRPIPRVSIQEEETPPPEIKPAQETSSESTSTQETPSASKQYKQVPETGSKGSQKTSVRAAKSQEAEFEEPATEAKRGGRGGKRGRGGQELEEGEGGGRSRIRGQKPDLRQIRDVARKKGIDAKEFGNFVHKEKQLYPEGDYTYEGLRKLADLFKKGEF